MRYPLRTLSQVRNTRRATHGQLGADVVGICDTCGSRWPVDLDQAVRALGDAATSRDLVSTANCPNCSGGRCADTYLVVDTEPARRSVWYPGSFESALDTTDVFTAPKRPRRR
jgi:hypothetical protein